MHQCVGRPELLADSRRATYKDQPLLTGERDAAARAFDPVSERKERYLLVCSRNHTVNLSTQTAIYIASCTSHSLLILLEVSSPQCEVCRRQLNSDLLAA